MAAIIAALIIVVGFGVSLLVWFHFEDKRDAQMNAHGNNDLYS
jgi:hypothetical protein